MREFPLPLPSRMRDLPVDRRGYPVPKFVEWIDGQPDFRVVDSAHLSRCVRHRRCWICGEPLGGTFAFVIGPMCAVNRINAEPPSHVDCAQFAATACPFLSQPLARRNERDLPVETRATAGIMLEHNPTACCLWVTKNYGVRVLQSGVLFTLGDPLRLEFYHRGRPATRLEVNRAIDTGLPKLEAVAKQDGIVGERALKLKLIAFRRMLDRQPWPKEAA